ncbi:MAG: DAK2 domain-containing protein [Clostridia bacterium]|nr:DAK2 domain-containing protein [Clostridia bacterium]
MICKQIDSKLLTDMLANGHRNLMINADTVDDLNVFPVPDGDTGTNMCMTLAGAVSACPEEAMPVGEMMAKVSRGALLSARGNSGVILSQFIRGIALGTAGKEYLTSADFAVALSSGVSSAYDSVIRPVEGTMLTVMREGSEFFTAHLGDSEDICVLFSSLINAMKESLARTPELLPVLKEAGVIDSGGAGLICIFEGMEMALKGEMLNDESGKSLSGSSFVSVKSTGSFGPDSELEYGYCTEFILQLQNKKTDISSFSIEPIIDYLKTVGNSIVAVTDGDLVKVHVHTFVPEEVMAYARKFGEFVTIKIENMSVQHSETAAKQSSQKAESSEPPKKFAIVAVASGEGTISYFKEIGADIVIDGGQTNNPSAEDFIAAFRSLNAEHIVVLPDNSNIVLTAVQAAELYDGADVRVIKTKSVAEGYSALSMMDLSSDTVEELIEGMSAYLSDVTTGYVTTATRDTSMNGVTVRKGDYIGLDNERIICAENNKLSAAMSLLKGIDDIEDKQVLTVFSGCDVTLEELSVLKAWLRENLPYLENGFIDGGQNVYSFIFSIE